MSYCFTCGAATHVEWRIIPGFNTTTGERRKFPVMVCPNKKWWEYWLIFKHWEGI